MEYNCELCKYKTNHQTNYKKHLMSNKHKRNEEESNKKQFSCKYCGQMYHHKQSVNKHIKYSCTKNKDEDLKELVRLLNDKLDDKDKLIENKDKQLDHKDKLLENKDKQIEKLKGKLEININTTVNNIHNNITLLSYTKTDTSYLTDNDYKTCIKKRNGCVLKMIEKLHFNPEKPENMNLYIPSMKDKYLMMYEDGNWKLTNKKDAIEKIYEDKEDLIMCYMDTNNPRDLKPDIERYLELKTNETAEKNQKSLYEEVNLMLYNNKHIVMKQSKTLIETNETSSQIIQTNITSK
jgi:hypothetical protein